MSKIITLRKGLDINLRGKAQESLADAPQASEYALSPLDFEGVTPKLLVKVGDRGESRYAAVLQQVQRARPLHVARQRDGCCRQPRGEAQGALRNRNAGCHAELRGVRQARPPESVPRGDCRTAAPFGPLADDRAAALWHHRRPERHAEGRFHFRLRLRAAGPGLQLRAPQRAEESPGRHRGDAPPHAGQSAPLGACQGRGADAHAQGCRAAHLRGQASRGQRRHPDPPHRPREQGRRRVDGQYPGSGHHRPPVQRRPRRHDEDHRRSRL